MSPETSRVNDHRGREHGSIRHAWTFKKIEDNKKFLEQKSLRWQCPCHCADNIRNGGNI